MNNKITFKFIEEDLTLPAYEVLSELDLSSLNNTKIQITVSKGNDISITRCEGEIHITYTRKNEFFRALSYIPSFIEDGKEIHEQAKFSMLCFMAEASRNAVYNIPTAKKMIRYIAMMGYDSMMLYTEDTYDLPEYKYFGHMRGKFSEAELCELDDYADLFGIELIPCVQTLAHLSTALRWPEFDGYKDNHDILLVGDDKTYKLVRAIISQCAKCFRSRKINIGMDEAHMIACGEYLKRNGFRKPSDVMIEHLERVIEICCEFGFKPMMWSDMFFRMAFGGKYYVKDGEVPPDVVAKVPEGVDLIYWDYYSFDPELFCHMIDCHKKFKNSTVFAGGAWKWSGFGAHNRFSLISTKMQLDNCIEKNIDRVIVTAWGDNGGEASQFSVLSSMLYYAERNYCDVANDAQLDIRARLCFDISFSDLLAFDLPDTLPENPPHIISHPTNPSKYLLYNDPLERFMDAHLVRETVSKTYADNAKRLEALSEHKRFGYAFNTLSKLCSILELKADLGCKLYDAYNSGDRDTLAHISGDLLPEIIKRTVDFLETFRTQWYSENKTFGFTTQEIRLGGLIARLDSVKLRIDSYLRGECDRIEELEYPALPFKLNEEGKYISCNNWVKNVSAGVL